MQRFEAPLVRSKSLRMMWGWVSITGAIAITGAAAIVLFKVLRRLDYDQVLRALSGTPASVIAIAAIFTALGYLTLTFYDLFALRIIGRHTVPYRVTALASFTSYAIGHNLGAVVLICALVRFRVYARWGVTVVDVGKIAFVTGVTFWLGNLFLIGGGLLWSPSAVASPWDWPIWPTRAIGVSCLLAIGGYFFWLALRERVIGFSDWSIRLPGVSGSVTQLAIGTIEISFGAAALYVLLPNQSVIGFGHCLVVYTAAMFLGVLSQSPGSLGVVEAAVLTGLPQFHRETLFASLLMFRLLYFVLPLFGAVAALVLHELLRAVRGSSQAIRTRA